MRGDLKNNDKSLELSQRCLSQRVVFPIEMSISDPRLERYNTYKDMIASRLRLLHFSSLQEKVIPAVRRPNKLLTFDLRPSLISCKQRGLEDADVL
jgi:hypothetical protein